MQLKRALSRVEAGTSGVLSISDSGRRVTAEYGEESHASSSVEEWISPCLSSCARSDRPLVELSVEPVGFTGRCMGVYGIFQARVPEWVAISFSRGSS